MPYRTMWTPWPEPSDPSRPSNSVEPHPRHDVSMMLGRLIERSEHVIRGQDEIKSQLREGAQRFREHEERIVRLEERVDSKDHVPRLERLIKRWLAYLLPPLALWSTGSVDAAIRVLEAALKLRGA